MVLIGSGVKKLLGQLLIERELVREVDLERALKVQQSEETKLGKVLVDMRCITEGQLNEALAVQTGVEVVALGDVEIEKRVISLVPAEIVSRYKLIPLYRDDTSLKVAMCKIFDSRAIQELRLATGCSISRCYAEPAQIEKAILKYYGSNVARMLGDLVEDDSDSRTDIQVLEDLSADKLQEMAREPSLVNLVNLIIYEAIEAKASDIHIEPFEDTVKTKYRIDGVLLEKSPSPKKLQAAIISRIKIMANMNIAERFVPQDGHIEFSGRGGKIDIRVSTVPSVFGEAITMRILDRTAALISLGELGMNSVTLDGFQKGLSKSHGIVLVTGPTGSGKSTTLYASLNEVYDSSLKIITIEDPVEYQLGGIIQMPVNPRRGLTFARGLRHILRQDPDIVMIGEIRDKETADIAIRAALTGHLVFSTLHTNDAAGAISRLIDMGMEPFLLASSLEGVLAQRLVRKICPYCKESYKPESNVLRNLGSVYKQINEDTVFYRGRGCSECNNTGLKGRIGIYELLRISDGLRELIAQSPTPEQIMKEAPSDHFTMRQDGIEKVLAGVTTLEEVLRVTQISEE